MGRAESLQFQGHAVLVAASVGFLSKCFVSDQGCCRAGFKPLVFSMNNTVLGHVGRLRLLTTGDPGSPADTAGKPDFPPARVAQPQPGLAGSLQTGHATDTDSGLATPVECYLLTRRQRQTSRLLPQLQTARS